MARSVRHDGSVALIYRVSRLDEDGRAREVSRDVQRENGMRARDLEGLTVESLEDSVPASRRRVVSLDFRRVVRWMGTSTMG
jgi:hypothetical protein